jgi:hypothetical protein
MKQPPGIGGNRLEVSALRFRVERAEGQRRLARARDAREHDQGIARDVHVHVLQVVFPGAAHVDEPVGGAQAVRPARRSLAGHGVWFGAIAWRHEDGGAIKGPVPALPYPMPIRWVTGYDAVFDEA